MLYEKETGFACLIVVVLFLRVYLDENGFLFVGFGSVYLCPIGRKPVLFVWLCSFLSRPIGRKLVLQNLLHSQTCVPVQFDRAEINHYFEY